MKRIFTLLMGGLVLFSTACDSDKESGVTGSEWFLTPESTVNGTIVEVRCETKFGAGVLTGANSGFTYAAVTSAGVGSFESTATATASGSTIAATLSNLQPETLYVVYAYADFGGARMQSTGTTFTTGTVTDLPDPDPDSPAFGTPEATNVTASGATLSCGFTFEQPTADYTLYFEYRPVSDGSYTQKSVMAGTGVKSVTLSGLAASTAYEFRLCAEWQGERYVSDMGRFTTSSSEGGLTAYSGWAELPMVQDKSDYYYAYHLCPDVYVPGTNNRQLRRNYSVCYSDDLKCAIWVAAPMHTCYAQKNTKRTDAYREDPDISVSQPGKWEGYTRGHLLGSSERLVSNATNRQVFYYSNIAPQLGQPYFNTGGGAWNTLEDWVDTQWGNTADTTYQVIGCYWADRNKKVSGTTIPTHFYKVLLRTKDHKNKWVVDCSRDELQCIAIMIEHRTYSKSEVPQPSQYASKGLLMSVKALEEKTGLTFFANVPNAPKDTYNPSDWGL